MTVKELRTLIDNLDEYIHVPGGIERLKKTVLHLAVSGQLVPQDPSEGTGEELYRQIQAEKGKLINNGKFKKQASLSKITEDETPFKIPDSWIWVRPAEIGYINPRNSIDDDLNVGFIPMTMISEDFGTKPQFDQRRWGEVKKNFTHFGNGDVIMAKITPCFENSKAGIIRDLPNNYGAGTTELHVFRQDEQFIAPKYFYIWIKNPTYLEIGKTKMTGSAGQKRVPTDFFAQFPFPLPPIGEQARIAEKVDTIFNLIDRLAAKYIAEQNERKKLVSVALAGLARGDSELAFTHLTEIIRTKADASELRKTILHLAVSGQLVPQDPSESTGEDLYKQIQIDKNKVLTKRQKTTSEVTDDEKPFNVPSNWKWVRIGDIFQIRGGKRLPAGQKLSRTPSDHVYIRVTDMANGTVDMTDLHYVDNKSADEISRYIVTSDDLYLSIAGSIGKVGKIPQELSGSNLTENASRLTPYGNDANLDFYQTVIASGFVQAQFQDKKVQMAQPKLALFRIENSLIPLPPLEEQKRIVQKTTQLLDLVTELEKHLEK